MKIQRVIINHVHELCGTVCRRTHAGAIISSYVSVTEDLLSAKLSAKLRFSYKPWSVDAMIDLAHNFVYDCKARNLEFLQDVRFMPKTFVEQTTALCWKFQNVPPTHPKRFVFKTIFLQFAAASFPRPQQIPSFGLVMVSSAFCLRQKTGVWLKHQDVADTRSW